MSQPPSSVGIKGGRLDSHRVLTSGFRAKLASGGSLSLPGLASAAANSTLAVIPNSGTPNNVGGRDHQSMTCQQKITITLRKQTKQKQAKYKSTNNTKKNKQTVKDTY